ncbi:class I SAM-dependent methyltransferase [Candidatus Uabimicrobium sp. HlEnr_7]|uniref:class I SAM-dependent methyltransferase n=1 Tax=Candidatus Uabimicrobium helgolandensis TaxID=3095367 RepID=UPI003556F07F
MNCTVCASGEHEFMFSGKDQMLNIEGEYSLYRCCKCKSLLIKPVPKNLDKHYPRERYYALKGEDGIPGSGDALFRVFYAKNSSHILKLLSWPLRKAFRSTKIVTNGNFLDVGCGSGHFLVYMQTHGMNCYGVDSGRFSQEFAAKHNLNIFHGEVAKAKYPSDFFDVITMNHTLEHVVNPSETLRELCRILKPKGRLIIGVPQLHSIAYKIFQRHWAELDIPRHMFVCSTKNLKKLVTQAGFTTTKTRYNSNPVSFIMSIIYWKNSRSKNKIFFENIDWGKPLYGLLFFIFLPMCFICDVLHLGDQVELFVTKRDE